MGRKNATYMIELKVMCTRIPKPLQEKISGFLATRGYATLSDYLRDLIRKDVDKWESDIDE